MIILGVDYGEVRTGTAYCDSRETLAIPYCVITEKDIKKVSGKITEKAKEVKAELIVMGLPVNMDGSEGTQAKKCRELAELTEQNSSIPVILRDERLSTKMATQYMNQTDKRGSKRKEIIDAAAAAVILQNYLDYRKNSINK